MAQRRKEGDRQNPLLALPVRYRENSLNYFSAPHNSQYDQRRAFGRPSPLAPIRHPSFLGDSWNLLLFIVTLFQLFVFFYAANNFGPPAVPKSDSFYPLQLFSLHSIPYTSYRHEAIVISPYDLTFRRAYLFTEFSL